MVDGDVGVFLEVNAVEFCGQTKDTCFHPAQLKIGAQHFGIEVVVSQLEEVGIVGKVPRHKAEVGAFLRLRQLFHCGHLAPCDFQIVGFQAIEQFFHAFFAFGHALAQHVVGIVAISQ